jgi:hypothetical protein
VPLEEEEEETNTRSSSSKNYVDLFERRDRPDTHFSLFLTVSFDGGGVGVIVRLGFLLVEEEEEERNWFLRVEEYFRTPLSPPVSLLTPRRTLYT